MLGFSGASEEEQSAIADALLDARNIGLGKAQNAKQHQHRPHAEAGGDEEHCRVGDEGANQPERSGAESSTETYQSTASDSGTDDDSGVNSTPSDHDADTYTVTSNGNAFDDTSTTTTTSSDTNSQSDSNNESENDSSRDG